MSTRAHYNINLIPRLHAKTRKHGECEANYIMWGSCLLWSLTKHRGDFGASSSLMPSYIRSTTLFHDSLFQCHFARQIVCNFAWDLGVGLLTSNLNFSFCLGAFLQSSTHHSQALVYMKVWERGYKAENPLATENIPSLTGCIKQWDKIWNGYEAEAIIRVIWEWGCFACSVRE